MGYEYKLPKLISCSIFTYESALCFAVLEKIKVHFRNREKKVLVFGTAAKQASLHFPFYEPNSKQ